MTIHEIFLLAGLALAATAEMQTRHAARAGWSGALAEAWPQEWMIHSSCSGIDPHIGCIPVADILSD